MWLMYSESFEGQLRGDVIECGGRPLRSTARKKKKSKPLLQIRTPVLRTGMQATELGSTKMHHARPRGNWPWVYVSLVMMRTSSGKRNPHFPQCAEM